MAYGLRKTLQIVSFLPFGSPPTGFAVSDS
jgi:hypothetical protein